MSTSIVAPEKPAIVYPESDGQPIAENTIQFRWIVTIKEGLESVFRDRDDVFIAGDLFWYPVEGDPRIYVAPDVLVVIGRPKHDRMSYLQWEEDGVAPQVIFEIQSPGNRSWEMHQKLLFYERHGVQEYYVYHPEHIELHGYSREADVLRPIYTMDGWVSPLLGVRFDMSGSELRLFRSDGQPFLTFAELEQQRDQIAQQRDQIAQQRDQIAQQRDQIASELEQARQRAERMAARLRGLGVEPES